MKPSYVAYSTSAKGVARETTFESSKNAIAHAKQLLNERGACFVVRKDSAGSKVIFNTHEGVEDVVTHGEHETALQNE
jgi:hypothetical protein